jgi:hypothetical protein
MRKERRLTCFGTDDRKSQQVGRLGDLELLDKLGEDGQGALAERE